MYWLQASGGWDRRKGGTPVPPPPWGPGPWNILCGSGWNATKPSVYAAQGKDKVSVNFFCPALVGTCPFGGHDRKDGEKQRIIPLFGGGAPGLRFDKDPEVAYNG